jgi:Outer membrane protein beta-barrel domain
MGKTSFALALVLFVAATASAQVPASNAGSSLPVREGFWFNAGLGLGSLGCQDCDGDRESGLSGGLSLGGTLNDRLLIGVGTTGFAKSVEGETFTVGTLDGRVRFYPSHTKGFFLNGGVGLGSMRYAGESEFGLGVMFGVGWDIRVADNVSLTPFWNGFAMSNSNVDANVGQLGIGITIH